MDFLGITTTHLLVFLLVLARTAGIFFVAPVFGSPAIPPQVKVWLAASIALIFTPAVAHDVGSDAATLSATLSQPLAFAAALLLQSAMGFLIGYAASLVFMAVQFAGELVDLQIGFGTVNLLNPLANIPVSLVANLQYFLALSLFLTLDGHHYLLRGVAQSFQLLPVCSSAINCATTNYVGIIGGATALFAGTLLIAVKIAAPVVGALFLADVALGVMARTMPQMNILVVGFPLKIAVGLLVLTLGLPFFGLLMSQLFQEMPAQLVRLLGG